MTRTGILTTLAGLLSICAGAAAADRPGGGDVKLARALQGYLAAKPINCVALRRIRSSRIIDRTAIIYEIGGIVYVNRPELGAESLSDSNILVTKTVNGQICRGEVIQLVDRTSKFQAGFISLGEFVPYRKKSADNFPQRDEYSKPGY
jgi:hypothetical protein